MENFEDVMHDINNAQPILNDDDILNDGNLNINNILNGGNDQNNQNNQDNQDNQNNNLNNNNNQNIQNNQNNNIQNNQPVQNGNNAGEAGGQGDNLDIDVRHQENNPNNEVNDDIEDRPDDQQIRRRNSFNINTGFRNVQRRRRIDNENYNPLDEANYKEDLENLVPDLNDDMAYIADPNRRGRDANQREKERLRREFEQLEKEKAAFQKEKEEQKAKWLETEKKLLAEKKRKEELENAKKKPSKYKYTEKNDEKQAEKNGYKVGETKVGFTTSHYKKVNGMKHLVKDMDKTFRSSPKYRNLKNSLIEFDNFMKSISGRTRLTSAEMEMYDKLSLKVYKATNNYLLPKVDDRIVEPGSTEAKNALKLSDGKLVNPKNAHERARMSQVDEIKNSIVEMRKEMFKAQAEMKMKDLEKKCADAVNQQEKVRGDLMNKNLSSEELKAAVTDSVAKHFYYTKRIDTLKKSGAFDLKNGVETFAHGYKRLDTLLEPKAEDFAQFSKDPKFQEIVNAGVESIKSGKAFTGKNIDELFKAQAMKEGEKKIDEKRREENMKKPEEIKKEDPNLVNNMHK